jgi:hypothetical protein
MSAVSTNPLLLIKVAAAPRSLSNNKTPRVDGVTTELLKFEGPNALQWLYLLIIAVWEFRVVPSQWKRVYIVSLHKGGQHIMANYCGINLLDVCGKVYTAMLHQRM